MREYIIPNWHAILIHAPLGLLTTGLMLEILTLLWRRSTARTAGRWMLVVGAVMAVPALTSGIYAFHDIITATNSADDENFGNTWDDLRTGTVIDRVPESHSTGDMTMKRVPVTEMFKGNLGEELRNHIWRNSIALGGILLVVVTFIGCSDRWRRRLYVPLLLLLIASQGLMVNGAHNGGLIVYQEGAAIQPLPAGSPPFMQPTRQQIVERYLPPAQLHFTMAGWVVGFALLSLALAIRAMTQGEIAAVTAGDEDWFRAQPASTPPAASSPIITEAITPFGLTEQGTVTQERHEISRPLVTSAGPNQFTTVQTTATTTTVAAPVQIVPAGRFWLLTMLAAIVTFAAGLWLISAWNWSSLMAAFHRENRNRYHIIIGTSIVVLTLILAFLARFARRAKWALAFFSVLLFAALSLQVYVGILLTFDGAQWPLDKNAPRGLLTPLHWSTAQK